jgi:hypothetical protein
VGNTTDQASIRQLLVEQEPEAETDNLVKRLFNDVIPNLERFP